MLLKYLYEISPYENFPIENYKKNIETSFGFPRETICEALQNCPQKIIEIGSWHGRSAIFFADQMKNKNITPEVVCIDTWLGAQEMWKIPERTGERYNGLKLKNGYPTLYYNFLANIIHHNHQDCVVPFPNTSSIAFRLLKSINYTANLVYVDGSHDHDDVLQDITNYWQLILPDGIMVGDDYYWVKDAVNVFAKNNNLVVEDRPDQGWIIKK